MHGALRIREAVESDAPLLADWACAMALETEALELDAATVLAGVREGIADPAKARYFVAVRDVGVAGREVISQPVGTLMFTNEWSDWRCGMWWWIQSVYVAPAHRRAGVYGALHAHVEALARATSGVIGLRLYVEHANADAQRTYVAQGMHDAGYRMYESLLTRE